MNCFSWQALHFAFSCLPRSAKRVLSWSKTGSFHVRSPWQSAHFGPSEPLCVSSFPWQSTQAGGASRHRLPAAWQDLHSVPGFACAPRRAKSVAAFVR